MSMWWFSDVKLNSGACCARVAIVCCRVEMVSDVGMSGIVPLRRSAIRRPLPSTGSCGSVPRLHRYYEAFRLPAAHPAALRCLRLAVPLCALVFRSRRRPNAAAAGQGLLDIPAAPRAGHRAETAGPPRFLENPSVLMPCSSTPVGPPRQAISTLRCCLPWLLQRRLPRLPLAGLYHTACSLAVHASSPRSLAATQDSLPTAGQALSGGAGHPLGSLARFQSSLHLILPAQACPGAQ